MSSDILGHPAEDDEGSDEKDDPDRGGDQPRARHADTFPKAGPRVEDLTERGVSNIRRRRRRAWFTRPSHMLKEPSHLRQRAR